MNRRKPGPGRSKSKDGDLTESAGVAPPSKAVAPVARREDRRRTATKEKILREAMRLAKSYGASGLTIQVLCEEIGISRGTFYRYFASKEALLADWHAAIRQRYSLEITRLISENPDPASRLSAYAAAIARIIKEQNLRQMLEVDPHFALQSIEAGYWYNIRAMERALDVVYDSWEEQIGGPINRYVISEIMLRCIVSTAILPTQMEPTAVVAYLRELVGSLANARGAVGPNPTGVRS